MVWVGLTRTPSLVSNLDCLKTQLAFVEEMNTKIGRLNSRINSGLFFFFSKGCNKWFLGEPFIYDRYHRPVGGVVETDHRRWSCASLTMQCGKRRSSFAPWSARLKVNDQQCFTRAPGWLFDIGDEILPNFYGDYNEPINKDPDI